MSDNETRSRELRNAHERSYGWALSECRDREALKFDSDKERDRHTAALDYRTLRDLTDIADALPGLLDENERLRNLTDPTGTDVYRDEALKLAHAILNDRPYSKDRLSRLAKEFMVQRMVEDGLRGLIAECRVEIDRRWSFTETQQHTHTWHDKQDFLEWLLARIDALKGDT